MAPTVEHLLDEPGGRGARAAVAEHKLVHVAEAPKRREDAEVRHLPPRAATHTERPLCLIPSLSVLDPESLTLTLSFLTHVSRLLGRGYSPSSQRNATYGRGADRAALEGVVAVLRRRLDERDARRRIMPEVRDLAARRRGGVRPAHEAAARRRAREKLLMK